MSYFGPQVIGNFKTKREKRKRVKTPVEKRAGKDPAYIKKIVQLPCCVSGPGCGGGIEPHHLKCTGERGGALKSTDKWAVPLCHEHHINGVELAGSRNEKAWFQLRGIDPLTLANALWNSRHDLEAMGNILETHRSG